MSTRRTRIVYIREHDFLAAFECVAAGFPHLRDQGSINQLRRVRLLGVPADATPIRVYYDHCRDAFGIIIEHPSFDRVPISEMPPVIDCEITVFQCDHLGRVIPESPTHSEWDHNC